MIRNDALHETFYTFTECELISRNPVAIKRFGDLFCDLRDRTAAIDRFLRILAAIVIKIALRFVDVADNVGFAFHPHSDQPRSVTMPAQNIRCQCGVIIAIARFCDQEFSVVLNLIMKFEFKIRKITCERFRSEPGRVAKLLKRDRLTGRCGKNQGRE